MSILLAIATSNCQRRGNMPDLGICVECLHNGRKDTPATKKFMNDPVCDWCFIQLTKQTKLAPDELHGTTVAKKSEGDIMSKTHSRYRGCSHRDGEKICGRALNRNNTTGKCTEHASYYVPVVSRESKPEESDPYQDLLVRAETVLNAAQEELAQIQHRVEHLLKVIQSIKELTA
jgi:hypothetical protein